MHKGKNNKWCKAKLQSIICINYENNKLHNLFLTTVLFCAL